jgi:hypothetical protein
MKTLNCYAAALLLAVSLTAPLVMADDHDKQRYDNKRYYDKSHKDYHQWNENENRSYGLYLNEKHMQVHVWKKARPTEQQQYWKWRHEHPDERR